MKLHANAALSLKRRELLVLRVVEQGWSLTKAAEAAEVSEPTARKWAQPYRSEGDAGPARSLLGRRRVHNRTPEDRIQVICALRRLRMTGAEIAEILGDGRDHRLGDPQALRPRPPRAPGHGAGAALRALASRRAHPHRRQEARPDRRRRRAPRRRSAKAPAQPSQDGRLGRPSQGVGYECVHVCVDDATRLAYVEVLADEKASTAIGFLRRAVRFYRRHGVAVEGVMTDNGSAYRSAVHAIACRTLGSAT